MNLKDRVIREHADQAAAKRSYLIVTHAKVIGTTDIYAWAKGEGRQVLGYTSKRSPLREELINQPLISGFCGPMWGGNKQGVPVIRYEDQVTYDTLSK